MNATIKQMPNGKRNYQPTHVLLSSLIFTLSTILLILSTTTVFAQEDSSCFLHPDSQYYCQEINQITAQTECASLEDCDINTNKNGNDDDGDNNNNDKNNNHLPFEKIYPGVRCSFFEECEQLFCQSTCDFQTEGSCGYGEVPDDKIVSWCAPSCCQFSGSNGPFCQTVSNEWECQVTAQNNAAQTYAFGQEPMVSCTQNCVPNAYPNQVSLKQTNSFRVYDFEQSIQHQDNQEDKEEQGVIKSESNSQSSNIQEKDTNNNNHKQDTNHTTENKSGPSFVILSFPLVAILIIAWFLFKKQSIQSPRSPKSTSQNSNQTKKREMQSSKNSTYPQNRPSNHTQEKKFEIPTATIKKPYAKKRHHLDRKKHQVDKEFLEYQSTNHTVQQKTHLHKLGSLIKRHQSKHKAKQHSINPSIAAEEKTPTNQPTLTKKPTSKSMPKSTEKISKDVTALDRLKNLTQEQK